MRSIVVKPRTPYTYYCGIGGVEAWRRNEAARLHSAVYRKYKTPTRSAFTWSSPSAYTCIQYSPSHHLSRSQFASPGRTFAKRKGSIYDRSQWAIFFLLHCIPFASDWRAKYVLTPVVTASPAGRSVYFRERKCHREFCLSRSSVHRVSVSLIRNLRLMSDTDMT